MVASTGPPSLPSPATEPNLEKLKQKLLRSGVVPTPKIIHTLRKRELQKSNRRISKQTANQPQPLTDAQQEAISDEFYFRTVKSEYKRFNKTVDPKSKEKLAGRPWEGLENLKLKQLASESNEYSGEILNSEHLRELGDLIENDMNKFRWLLDDDIEPREGWLEKERPQWSPPKRSEADAIRILVERLSGTELSLKDWKFSRIMKESGLQFIEGQMLKIVGALGERGQWRHALSVVEWVYNSKDHRHSQSRFVYTKLLAVLGKARRPKEALQVFNWMRGDRHLYPDMAAYRSVAVTLGQAGLLKELIKVMELMKEKPKKIRNMHKKNWDPILEPDLVVFNAILNACVSCRQWRGVFWVFQQLRKTGLKPNGATYGLAMEVMLKSQNYDLVHEFFRKMNKSGEAPKAITYKVLVKTFWGEGKVKEAVQAIRDMEQRGIVATPCVYYELGRCLCYFGMWEEALQEIEKLKTLRRTRPLEVTFTGMILSSLDGGHVKECISIFEYCQGSKMVDVGIINAMLKVYGRNDMFLEAKALFEECRTPGYTTSANSQGCMVSPDRFTFSAMLEASASALQWEYFEYVYKQMALSGYQLDQSKHASLLVEASRAGKGHLLDHAFDLLLEAGEIPSPTLFSEMVCQATAEYEYERAITLISALTHAPFQISEQQWISVFEANEDRINKSSMKELWEKLSTCNLAMEGTVLNLSQALHSLSETCRSSVVEDSLSEKTRGDSALGGCEGVLEYNRDIEFNDASSISGAFQMENSRTDTGTDKRVDLRKEYPLPSSNWTKNWKTRSNKIFEDVDDTLESEGNGLSYSSGSLRYSEDEDLDFDIDQLELDISSGESNNASTSETNVPSAQEILEMWKEARETNCSAQTSLKVSSK